MNKITYNNLSTEQQKNLKEAFDKIKFKINFGIDAEDEESARTKLEAKIFAKLESGKSLTQKEMQYLRQYNPALYMMAVRVEQKRKSLEHQLKNADSKEEVQDIVHASIASVKENDPAKQYMVAAIQETVKEFKETEQYKKLPETEEQAEKKENKEKKNTESLVYEQGEQSYQMAYIKEEAVLQNFHMVV